MHPNYSSCLNWQIFFPFEVMLELSWKKNKKIFALNRVFDRIKTYFETNKQQKKKKFQVGFKLLE